MTSVLAQRPVLSVSRLHQCPWRPVQGAKTRVHARPYCCTFALTVGRVVGHHKACLCGRCIAEVCSLGVRMSARRRLNEVEFVSSEIPRLDQASPTRRRRGPWRSAAVLSRHPCPQASTLGRSVSVPCQSDGVRRLRIDSTSVVWRYRASDRLRRGFRATWSGRLVPSKFRFRIYPLMHRRCPI